MSGGFTFGGAAAQKPTGFGFTATTSAAPFGAPSQPTQTPGLTFGSLGQPGALSFGTPQQQQAQQTAAGLAFGTQTTSQAGLSFGQPATSQAGLSFGQPATSQTGLSFGQPATSQAGLSFGQPASSQTGLSFGQPAAPATSQPGISFGQPATPAATQTGLTFGTPSAPQTLSFATPATSAPVFGSAFAAPAASVTSTPGAFSFGTTPAATSASAGFSFGGPGGALTTGAPTATTAQPLGGFAVNFGVPATATTTSAPLMFNLGATPATSAPSTSGAPGLFAPTSTPSLGFPVGGLFTGLGAKPLGGTTAPITTASAGLGGVDPGPLFTGLAGGRLDSKVVKDNQVPNEILQTVDNFKTFLRTQKNLSSDIARGTAKPLNKVQEEIESLKQILASLQNGIHRSSALVVKLKSDTAKCLQNAEMAQRTHETPAGLQYDNTAPLRYFQDLVASFEHEMKIFRNEINNTEKHLHSLMQPMPLTTQELALAMRRLHDSFVALAGRLQSVHSSVEAEKNQYLLLRKYFLKDTSNVFEEAAKKSGLDGSKGKPGLRGSAGPTPFSALGTQHGFGLLSASSAVSKSPLTTGWSGGQTMQLAQQPQQPPQLQQRQFSAPTLSNTLFGAPSTSFATLTSPQPVENQNFQLQKPPVGNKRGKR